MKLMTFIKTPLRILRKIYWNIIWFIFGLMPVNKNKIVVVSFYGKGYSDNPKYILNELLKQKSNFKYYWAVKKMKSDNELPSSVNATRYESLRYIYHLRTAAVWIDNCRKWTYVKKRNNQLYINTYHGFPLKRIEKDVEKSLDKSYVESAINDSNMVDFFISGSKFMTKIYEKSFWYSGVIAEVGTPRNDPLLKIDNNLVKKIRTKLNVQRDKKVLLYAPTFRKDQNIEVYDLDYKKTTDALKNKFGGDWITLVKLHPNIAKKSKKLDIKDKNIIDVTMYNDMQELLIIADVLITDYSSSMFDYMLTKRPVFIYATDYEAYQNDRSFYFKFSSLPFILNQNIDELENTINNFNLPTYLKKCNHFMIECGYNENGSASSAVAKICTNHVAMQKKSSDKISNHNCA